MTNPLLELHDFPPFKRIDAEHAVPAIRSLIEECENVRETLLSEPDSIQWDSFIGPMDAVADRLEQAWSPVRHMNSVVNSEQLREAHNECVVTLTNYSTRMAQHEGLYKAYIRLMQSDEYKTLNQAQRRVIENTLRDFRLAGAGLDEKNKKRFGEIKAKLSALKSQFANNILDATQGWWKHFSDKSELSGLPESDLANAQQEAKQKGLEGYVVTLEMPSYMAIMKYADNRSLRSEVYQAYSTRASENGICSTGDDPLAWNNSPLIDEILSLRHEMANLLEFPTYAHYSLATKMAKSPEEVIQFLTELSEKAKPIALAEYHELKQFSATELGIETLQAWDITYCSEKLRQKKYAIADQELKPYFPAEKVISGMFSVAQRLFDIRIEAIAQQAPDSLQNSIETWHPDVTVYRVYRGDQVIAYFYLDIYARANKRGGAWMDECRVRRKTPSGLQLPVAYLTCNFTPPVSDQPSLLTHIEVTTLFHEFGHGLHHMLTQIEYAGVSGINGVAWDAVELPSQFLENWCWEKSVIPLISSHYQTGDALPEAYLEKLIAAKNFQAGMLMIRQLEFSLFDFKLHLDYDVASPVDVQQVLDTIRQDIAVVIPPPYNRFQNSFSHIFSGGYAAGYYSYKWAEVLSSDAFSIFEERGIFDRETGQKFMHEILEKGGSEDAMELFVKFRGREPRLDALLRHSGISVGQ